jgi:hypothetical protein
MRSAGQAQMAQRNIYAVRIEEMAMDISQKEIAELAAEYWKLLRAFERAAMLAPDSAKARLGAQARYSGERLTTILERVGMRAVSFDGVKFEVNLPASAVNAEDMNPESACLVERTLEPAIVTESAVILTGKVFLAESKAEG